MSELPLWHAVFLILFSMIAVALGVFAGVAGIWEDGRRLLGR
ncbi:MAG: hypothetical protein AB7K24_18595 [Gemmataceae bacterium]